MQLILLNLLISTLVNLLIYYYFISQQLTRSFLIQNYLRVFFQNPLLLVNCLTVSYLLMNTSKIDITVTVIALLLFAVQDCLTGYVATFPSWGILIATSIYHLLHNQHSYYHLIILVIITIILICCVSLKWLGVGDIAPFLLALTSISFIDIPVFLLLMPCLGLFLIWWSKEEIIPFVPCISLAYYWVTL